MNSLVKETLDRLVTEIESGKNPWRKSWKGGGGMPTNGVTGHTYRGINTLLLWVAGERAGYSSNRWATFKQWQEKGRAVQKGSKGTTILFYKILERGEGEDKSSFPMMRCSWLFNEWQLEGGAEEPGPEPTPEERHVRALAWTSTLGIKVGQGAPAYIPGIDELRMPMPGDFTDLDEYWASYFHEAVHWTGHKSRLDRPMVFDKSDIKYAAEELVAEIGAAFLNAEFGIDTAENNAAYLRHWLGQFTDKREAIFSAAKQASRAFEFLTVQPVQLEEAA